MWRRHGPDDAAEGVAIRNGVDTLPMDTQELEVSTDGYESMGWAVPASAEAEQGEPKGGAVPASLREPKVLFEQFLLQSGYDQDYKDYLRRRFAQCSNDQCGLEVFPWMADDDYEWPVGVAYTYGNVFQDLLRRFQQTTQP
jgi:hypothetical protein